MGLISNIISSFQIRKRLNNEYRPFFKQISKDLMRLETLREEYPTNINIIFEQLNNNQNKFKKEIDVYRTNLPRLKEHNKIVKKINDGMKGFAYKEILNNPFAYDLSEIEKYSKISKEINLFDEKDDFYTAFCVEVNNIKSHFGEIKEEYLLFNEVKKIFNFTEVGYIDSVMKEAILSSINSIRTTIKKYEKNLFYDFTLLDLLEERVEEHNDNYIKKYATDEILSNVTGKSLDLEQRTAVVQDETASLTIAGAGSGKTLTICGKIKWLIEKQGVNPRDILLLSYSKKSADDLDKKTKLINDYLKVGTFHKLGLDILKDVEKKNFIIEEQFDAIIEEYFRVFIFKNRESLHNVLKYYALFVSSNDTNKKYKNKGELYTDLKDTEFDTLKYKFLNYGDNKSKKETIKHELVKSYEELAIANFYFINGIDYEYERPYEYDVSTFEKRQYTPDFYLPKYKLYHEHFGVDENNKAKQYEGKEAESYILGMKWKQALHADNKTDCLETYSYEFQNGTVFEKLEKELKKRGVKFSPLTDEQVIDALNSIYEGQTFKSLISLVKSFISLYKSRYLDSSHFNKLKESEFENDYHLLRSKLFLDICEDVYEFYIQKIRGNKKIDFDDMILQATNRLKQTNKFRYKYIIVDEFQDISYSRMLFLKELIKHGNSKIFAVGDDWQAIYRFSGCDINIFLEFEKYFGYSRKNYITTTYRNSQQLQDVASSFIETNPEQFKKKINSKISLKSPIQIAYYENNKYQILIKLLNSIYVKKEDASILLLGRNNHDINCFYSDVLLITKSFNNDSRIYIKYAKHPSLKISFSTVHSSKGLEDEYVIIINADDETNGFPNKVEDDPLLNLVLSKSSNYLYAEERRLWYVALTRTKSYTFIIANRNNPSIFLNEIKTQCRIMNEDKKNENEENYIYCPECKSGHLVLRQNGSEKFYGCSNFPYCRYTINDFKAVNENNRCPSCGDFLVVRKGKNGRKFLGCRNYPRCKYYQ